MKNLQRILAFILIVFSANTIMADIPPKPNQAKGVNDFAGIFSAQEASLLESKLDELNNTTNTQIVIVTVNSLDGETPAMYATRIGESWGVGNAQFDNGIVILYKPKTPEENGEVFIAVGYGLEGVIPDAIANRIIDVEMIPEFKKGNIYTGIDNAVNTLISLSKKEFTAKDYENKHPRNSAWMPLIIILFIVFILIMSSLGNARKIRRSSMGRSNLPFWVLLSMLGSSNRRSGSFGNFSSGGGSFGGGGGGFGGFGGGSFGGGGAGGSW